MFICWGTKGGKTVRQTELSVISECVLCDYSYDISIDVCLLKAQMNYHEQHESIILSEKLLITQGSW
jgi:hypothetical protein